MSVPWPELPPWKQAQEWAKVDPETAKQVLKDIQMRRRHERRMDHYVHLSKLAPSVFGLVAVIVTALLTKSFLDHGAPVQGAWVFGTTAVSLASAFVTKKLVKSQEADLPGSPACE